ncbi:hypothetical protein SNEBB_005070 [Seison nebaliae]|nr:hypothetical protein SNEBB_005070 [Seison nebaliae]
MNKFFSQYVAVLLCVFVFHQSTCLLPEQGYFEIKDIINNTNKQFVHSITAGDRVLLDLDCRSSNLKFTVKYYLEMIQCQNDISRSVSIPKKESSSNMILFLPVTFNCDYDQPEVMERTCQRTEINKSNLTKSRNVRAVKNESDILSVHAKKQLLIDVCETSEYAFTFELYGPKPSDWKDHPIDIRIEIKNPRTNRYLSASNKIFIPFYSLLCCVYTIFAIIWLFYLARYWRQLLRIQFWIGFVILIGMIEKAMYLAEYEQVDKTGKRDIKIALAAEIVSAGKRSLARILILIVAFGYGIVKPRLGELMRNVLLCGIGYFILSLFDAFFKVFANDPKRAAISQIPLAGADAFLCYWIFTTLHHTIKVLRERNNIVKLNLYRHFTFTLICCVLASIVFMILSLFNHHFTACMMAWKNMWMDTAIWQILFSLMLLVIIILWRPSKNNQRYAFSPLLDDDQEEDIQLDHVIYDSDNVKQRLINKERDKSADDNFEESRVDKELEWMDKNIPEKKNSNSKTKNNQSSSVPNVEKVIDTLMGTQSDEEANEIRMTKND